MREIQNDFMAGLKHTQLTCFDQIFASYLNTKIELSTNEICLDETYCHWSVVFIFECKTSRACRVFMHSYCCYGIVVCIDFTFEIDRLIR